MHKREEFESYPIMETLLEFSDDFDFPSWSEHNLLEIKATVEEIKDIIKDEYPQDEYQFRLTPTWYSQDGVNLDSAKFTISLDFPSTKPTVSNYIKKTFTIDADIYFYDNLLKNIGKFLDEYNHALILQDNLDEFNGVIRYIANYARMKHNVSTELTSELERSEDIAYLHKNRAMLQMISQISMSFIDSLGSYKKDKTHLELKDFIIDTLIRKLTSYSMYTLSGHSKLGSKKAYVALSEVLDSLNEVLQVVSNAALQAQKAITPMNITFTLGDYPLLEHSKDHAVFGLTIEVIKNMASLPLFNEYQSNLYTEEDKGGVYWNFVLEALGIDPDGNPLDREPYTLLYIDNPFVKALGLYQRPNTKLSTIVKTKYKTDKKQEDNFEDFDMGSSIDTDLSDQEQD